MRGTLGNFQKIMIILENVELSKAYSLILKGPLNMVSVERSFADAGRAVSRLRPALIICDPFPKEEEPFAGIDFLFKVRTEYPEIKQLVLADVYSETIITNVFKAGASGFILYEKGVEELLRAVEEISTGGAPMSSEVAACLVRSYHVSADNPLTRREQDVLREITTGKTYHYIADELHVSVDTVRTHVQHIFDKLNVKNKSEAVIKAKLRKLV